MHTDTPSAPTRHAEFWLYDGSIVLSVGTTLFRVHQTILANHSEVFSDLFTVPQPAGEPTIDACPVVQLYDDESEFTDLLRAVYRPDYLDTLPPDADLDTLMTFISGILRLSTKYMIRYLRQRCITLLLTKLPATFESYTAKSRSTSSSPQIASSSSSPALQTQNGTGSASQSQTQSTSTTTTTTTTTPSTSPTPPDRYRSDTIMRAINLALSTNVLEALPYAYYCVSRFPHKRLLKDRPTDISWRTKAICLVGRERLSWAQMSLSHSFLVVFQRSPRCGSVLCAHARGPSAEWRNLEVGGSTSPHPLREYDGWERLNVCKECVEYCKERHSLGRREVWRCLPGMFELPGWEELRRVQGL